MKSMIVFALFVAAAVAVPVYDVNDAAAKIEEHSNNNIGTPDGYKSGYRTSNGISVSEEGQIKNVGTENEALEVRGQFSYVGPDGVTYAVTYIANENGFQPSAPHIPTVA